RLAAVSGVSLDYDRSRHEGMNTTEVGVGSRDRKGEAPGLAGGNQRGSVTKSHWGRLTDHSVNGGVLVTPDYRVVHPDYHRYRGGLEAEGLRLVGNTIRHYDRDTCDCRSSGTSSAGGPSAV